MRATFSSNLFSVAIVFFVLSEVHYWFQSVVRPKDVPKQRVLKSSTEYVETAPHPNARLSDSSTCTSPSTQERFRQVTPSQRTIVRFFNVCLYFNARKISTSHPIPTRLSDSSTCASTSTQERFRQVTPTHYRRILQRVPLLQRMHL
jgi:hypothetical protein